MACGIAKCLQLKDTANQARGMQKHFRRWKLSGQTFILMYLPQDKTHQLNRKELARFVIQRLIIQEMLSALQFVMTYTYIHLLTAWFNQDCNTLTLVLSVLLSREFQYRSLIPFLKNLKYILQTEQDNHLNRQVQEVIIIIKKKKN